MIKKKGKKGKEKDKVKVDDGGEFAENDDDDENDNDEGEDCPTERIIVMKEGVGRLYYRLGLKYIPNNLRFNPADFGFSVQRFYEGVDNTTDVWREYFKKDVSDKSAADLVVPSKQEDDAAEKEERGIWHVKVGSRVRVVLKMTLRDTRFHIALVDKLPAGFEALNPSLLGQLGYVPERPKDAEILWDQSWVIHTNMRDERVEAFASYVPTGQRGFSYIARATTKGVFVVPPAKAEEMYSPELFGRTGTDIIIVES